MNSYLHPNPMFYINLCAWHRLLCLLRHPQEQWSTWVCFSNYLCTLIDCKQVEITAVFIHTCIWCRLAFLADHVSASAIWHWVSPPEYPHWTDSCHSKFREHYLLSPKCSWPQEITECATPPAFIIQGFKRYRNSHPLGMRMGALIVSG